ncbi:MAG: LuxR C-terminal-related transcriptional regulator [Legionella sp.]|jgi:DNA-binding CsgD family transcriptional regulator
MGELIKFMRNMYSSLLSQEKLLLPYKNGVKLFEPEEVQHLLDLDRLDAYRLSHILQLPCCIAFMDTSSRSEHINEEGLNICGHNSLKDSMGKTIADITDSITAKTVLENHQYVYRAQKLKCVDEDIVLHKGIHFQTVGILIPWYQEKLQGLLAFNIVLGTHSIGGIISNLTNLNLLQQSNIPSHLFLGSQILDHSYLSTREQQCLFYYVQGRTSKEIGKLLYLSNRTIESYLESLKFKLGLSSKSELIDFMKTKEVA